MSYYATGYHATGYHATPYYRVTGVEPEAPTGGGDADIYRSKVSHLEKQLREEDEIIAMVAMAFIELID